MTTARRLVHGFILAGALAGLGCQGLQGTPPLALGQTLVTGLASDGSSVYWITGSGDVRGVSSTGGAVQQVSTTTSPTFIGLDTGNVYWTTGTGEIQRAPKAGGSAEALVQNVNDLGALQVDDSSVYWLVGQSEGIGSGQIVKAAKAPAAPRTVLLDMSPLDRSSITLTESRLYYVGTTSTATGVNELGVQGGTPTTDVTGSFSIVASATNTVCSAGPDPTALSADPNATAQAVTCSALDGSNAHLVATGLPAPVISIVCDDTTVYFATTDGAVSSVPVDANIPVVMSGPTSDSSGTGQAPGAGICAADAACACAGTTTGVQVCDGMGNGTCQCPSSATFAKGPAGGASLAIDTTSVYWAHLNGDAIFALPRN